MTKCSLTLYLCLFLEILVGIQIQAYLHLLRVLLIRLYFTFNCFLHPLLFLVSVLQSGPCCKEGTVEILGQKIKIWP